MSLSSELEPELEPEVAPTFRKAGRHPARSIVDIGGVIEKIVGGSPEDVTLWTLSSVYLATPGFKEVTHKQENPLKINFFGGQLKLPNKKPF